jgi:hypothetical protein
VVPNASQHQAQLPSSTSPELTLGVFQQNLKPGMSQGDVAASVGSPNMVTSEGAGKETWVYDKIASETSYSSGTAGAGIGAGVLGIGVGGDGVLGGGVGGNAGASKSAGAARTTQKTLTVVVKFEGGKLKDWKYHQSKF